MNAFAAASSARVRSCPLSAQQLASLARTCDLADHPIRIADTRKQTIVQNPAARAALAVDPLSTRITFELVDHHDRLLGHVHIAPE